MPLNSGKKAEGLLNFNPVISEIMIDGLADMAAGTCHCSFSDVTSTIDPTIVNTGNIGTPNHT